MQIKSTLINGSGQVLDVFYRDINSSSDILGKKINGIRVYCFCDEKLVVVYDKDKKCWLPPGGGVEMGESAEDAAIRETKEETNMKVLQYEFIGIQDIFESNRTISEVRFVCMVEPYGPFVSDPDGDITEIKLIDPKDFKQYFDWGEIGDHLMARALELKAEMVKK